MKERQDTSIMKLNRALKFAQHHRPRGGTSNLYVVQSIDRDGNIIDESYGMNYLTDYGMSKFIKDGANFPTKLYVGTSPDLTENMLEINSLSNVPAGFESPATVTNASANPNYNFPMYYYPNDIGGTHNELISVICRFLECYYDYNVNDVDVNIEEYGIGDSDTQLWTRSRCYDINGSPISITKRVNTRMIFTVFLCMTYNASVIQEGWSHGRYALITTMNKFLKYHMKQYTAGTFKRDSFVARSTNETASAILNRTCDCVTNLQQFTMYRQTGDDQGYIDGFYNAAKGFLIMEPQTMTTPDELSILLRVTNNNWTSTGLSKRFGEDGEAAPFTQIDVTSKSNYGAFLYDRVSGAYTNRVALANDSTKNYCEESFNSLFANHIYYTNHETITEMRIRLNLKTDDPILKFDNPSLTTLYATDSYWNLGSWKFISNPLSIPDDIDGFNPRTAKYYITNTDETLKPIRAKQSLTLLPLIDGEEVQDSDFNIGNYPVNGTGDCCDNYDNGYFVYRNYIYFPKLNMKKAIDGINDSWDTYCCCYGDNIFVANRSNINYTVTNVSNKEEIVTLTRSSTTSSGMEGFSANTNIVEQYVTNTNQGFVFVQHVSKNEGLLIDFHIGGQVKHKLFNSKMGCAIHSTTSGVSRIAYVSADDNKIHIWNCLTESEDTLNVFDVPTNESTGNVHNVYFMFGLNQYLWFTDGANYFACCNLDQHTITLGTNAMTLINAKSNLQYVRMRAVDDVIVLWRYNDNTVADIQYICVDNPNEPLIPRNLLDFNTTTFTSSQATNNGIRCHLKYIQHNNSQKTLALILYGYYTSGSTHICKKLIIDLGKYLNPGADDIKVDYQYFYEQDGGVWTPYGEYMTDGKTLFPIAYLMNYRLIGSTKTISTVSHIRSIKDKSWSTTISNVPDPAYTIGIPPGSQM